MLKQGIGTFLHEETLGNNHIKIEPVVVMERMGSDRKIRFLVLSLPLAEQKARLSPETLNFS